MNKINDIDNNVIAFNMDENPILAPTWPYTTNNNCKRVFISYSWDNEEHKAWALNLCQDLRKRGIDSIIDQAKREGDDVIDFMKSGIINANVILGIRAPSYSDRAAGKAGGVRYETQMLKVHILHAKNEGKFIPILRKGNFESSFPTILSIRDGFDMRDDSKYMETIEEVANEINDNPTIKLIPLESSVIDKNSQDDFTKVYKDLSAMIINYLQQNPGSSIMSLASEIGATPVYVKRKLSLLLKAGIVQVSSGIENRCSVLRWYIVDKNK